jgi:hypothetical protein
MLICFFPLQWSWISWSSYRTRCFEPLHLQQRAEVGIELRDGTVLGWEQFHDRYAELNTLSQLSRFLHISTFVIHVRVFRTKLQRYKCRFDMKDGGYLTQGFDLDNEGTAISGSYKALFMTGRGSSQIKYLLAHEVDGILERVGVGWASLVVARFYDPDGKILAPKLFRERYGGKWYEEIASEYTTIRLG